MWAIEHLKYYLYGKSFTVIIDHQASISALNASKRSKNGLSRFTHIDYKSQSPVGLVIPPSEYDEEFVEASINAFINKFEVIDNVILSYP